MKRSTMHFVFAAVVPSAEHILASSQEKLKFAFIPKSSITQFWKSICAGVKLLAVPAIEEQGRRQ